TAHHQWGRFRRLSQDLEYVGFRRERDFCLVGAVLSGASCPRGQHVWLFKYEPGTPKDPLG
ncbi:MAG: hypothetical protein ACTHJW_09275, partial [Streptosporangiaceae bacterium]